MAPHLSTQQRQLIIDLRRAGYKIKDIERITGITRKTISHWLKRKAEGGSLMGYRRQNYDRATTAEQDRDICRAYIENPSLNLRDTAKLYNVSLCTIQRRLHDAGIKPYSSHAANSLQCQQCDVVISQDVKVYKCVQCTDMLLCAECETDDRHQDHCVMRFPSTRIYNKVRDLFKSLQEEFHMKLSYSSETSSFIHYTNTESMLGDVDVLSDAQMYDTVSSHIQQSCESISPKDKENLEINDSLLPAFVPEIELYVEPDPQPQYNTRKNVKRPPKKRRKVKRKNEMGKKKKCSKVAAEVMKSEEARALCEEIIIKIEPESTVAEQESGTSKGEG